MVRDRLYNTRQTSSIQAYVDTFMDISMLLNTSGLTPQQAMERFLSDIFFGGLRDVELIQRIRGISIEDRTMERVLREALDFEAAHHPSTQVTNNGYAPNVLRSSVHTGTVVEPSSTFNDPMDCDVLHSRNYHQQGSHSSGNKDNRAARGPPFSGTCHYCSRKGHKISECRTRAKDLANYESKMKDKYRHNQGGHRGSSSGSGIKSSSLNAINSIVNGPDYDRSFSPKSTIHNKVVDSSSYLSSTLKSEVSVNEVTHATPETIHKCENELSSESSSLSSTVEMSVPSDNNTRLPMELVPITASGISKGSVSIDHDQSLNHSSLVLNAAHLSHLNTVVSCNLPLYHGVVTSSDGSPLDVHILINNGASENYISPKISEMIAGTHHHVHGREVETAGGNTSPITERVVFDLNLQGHSSPMSAFVFDTKFDIILGRSCGVIMPILDDLSHAGDDVVAPAP
ncbi:hypothetical protein BD560DRAFT_440580 [Blakeslea trispora]|nr:hypothetical protein BD560DRAFT_440580 [Blakeslea trispora]